MGEPNWQNRTLFHHDNLPVLRAMNSESVDLIATDPPFNKSRDFHATPDSLAAGAKFQDRWSWDRDVHPEWVDQLRDDHPRLMEAVESARHAHSDGMGAFICFMAVRLLEMRRVLRPTGSLYLHCDPTASHYLKAVLDAIFGWRNFRNEIIWAYRTGGVSKKYWARKHDTLFFYAMSEYVHNPLQERIYYDKPFFTTKTDELGRHYADVYVRDVWNDIKPVINVSKKRTGYPTQKPIALLERIVRASSPPGGGGVILDPFAGCATTLVAAEALGRQWVGIDIWDNTYAVVLDRLEREGPKRFFGDFVTFTDQVPVRTDDQLTAAPFLKTKTKTFQLEPPGEKMTRAEMYRQLIERHGSQCQGCDRMFDDQRYLDLDHKTPRSEGGPNHISNRTLLCGPCNRLKSNTLTLTGLRRKNKQEGYMARPGRLLV